MSGLAAQLERSSRNRSFRYAVKVEHVVQRNVMLVHVPGSALAEPKEGGADTGAMVSEEPKPGKVTPLAEHRTVETKTVETKGDTHKPFSETKTRETTTIQTKEIGFKPTTETKTLETVVTEPNEDGPKPALPPPAPPPPESPAETDDSQNSDETKPDMPPKITTDDTLPPCPPGASHTPLTAPATLGMGRRSPDSRFLSANKPNVSDTRTLPFSSKGPRRMGRDGKSGIIGPRPRRPNRSSLDSKLTENQRPQYERQISQRSKKAVDDTSLGDTSPYGTLTDQDRQRIRPKAHNKISTFFSPFARQLGEKQEQLNDLLNTYSLNMPAMPELLTIGQGHYDAGLLDLENHWTDVVYDSETMTKKEKEQQMRIWELLRTEVEYIKRLKVITDLFMCCLLNLQNEMLLNEIETERVFSNIMEVHNVNCEFWEKYMSQVMAHSRETKEPLDPSLMAEGFARFEELFTPYTKYCLEQEGCQEYIKNKYRDNELFKTFVIWAEAQNQCNRLKLADLVVTPMQRLTRYKLLLSAILKETQNEDHRQSLREMIEHVEKFVNQVNSVMHQRQEQVRLSTIIDRIESYDVIDTNNDESARLVSEFCRLDLTCPVPGCGPKQRRHLLREGALKMKETTNKMDVFCFLFTDMFLVTKTNRKSQDKDKVKVIKPPMRLDKIVVHNLRDGVSFLLVYLNEYHMASAVYTFQGDAKPWVEAIRKAQDDYKTMRQTSLQRPESRLMYQYDGSEDNDEEYSAVFNNMPRPEYSPESTFSRLDSTGSVDGFMPTLSTPYQGGQDGHQPDGGYIYVTEAGSDEDRLKRLRSNMHSGGSGDSGTRPRSPRLQNIPVRRTTSGDSSSILEESEGGTYLTINTDRRLNQSSPATPETNRSSEDGAGYIHMTRRPQSACVRSDSGSSGEAGAYSGAPGAQKGFFGNQRSHELLGSSEDNYKARLNQRRRIGEKRYHTADAIREIGKDRDSAIHKRLSWNFPVNINLEENKPSVLKQKTFSSDSLRSVPSSSGVSSTGSLHMSPDTELAEGYESESTTTSVSSKRLSQIDLQSVAPHFETTGPTGNPQRASVVEATRSSGAVTAKGASVDEDSVALSQSNQISKSMPDISNLSTVPGEEEAHRSSNHGSPRQGQRRKMTHAQLQRIKKMMLLNSTLEASEV